jgi:Tfp pilus assembly protein PilV
MITKIAAILKSRRGETLMEGLVSILVFTILLSAVTLMIMTSLRVTGFSTREAGAMQEAANNALSGSADLASACANGDPCISTSINFGIVSGIVSVKVVEWDNEFTAFAPCSCP